MEQHFYKSKLKYFSQFQVGKFDVDFEEEDEDDWGTSNGCRIMAVMYDTDKVTTVTVTTSQAAFEKCPKPGHVKPELFRVRFLTF